MNIMKLMEHLLCDGRFARFVKHSFWPQRSYNLAEIPLLPLFLEMMAEIFTPINAKRNHPWSIL